VQRPQVRDAYRIFASFLVDPVQLLNKVRAVPHFIRNARAYRARSGRGPFELRASEVYFTSYERFEAAGSARGHYFHQDLWAARRVVAAGVSEIVDVGSRVDGFVAHVLPACSVRYVDIRPLPGHVEGLEYVPGSLFDMPFASGSVQFLSCLHVIEHAGLGRYGDDVDPDGHWKAARELARVLAPGGTLLLGTPVGRERLMFDAHRVFDPATVLEMFQGLVLQEFSLIDDIGDRVLANARLSDGRACEYGCGLFMFTKPAADLLTSAGGGPIHAPAS
jgi:SAM-dependent methyltransferase